MTTPVQAAPVQQLAVGLADTPQGQRLAVTVTMLLDADGAKALAGAIAAAAENMSSAGMAVATSPLPGVLA